MSRMLFLLISSATAVTTAACGQHQDQPVPVEEAQPQVEPTPPPVQPELAAEPEPELEKALKAAELANAIERQPDQVETILSNAGLEVEEFENLLFEVAADPLQAEAYAKARETTAPETPQSGEPSAGEAEPSPEG